MRVNWRFKISADIRGKITTGTKGKSKGGEDIPKSLDYFNITKFEELIEIYGKKPDKLYVIFPSDNIDEFFQTEYSVWATSKTGNPWKRRVCDGETCRHVTAEVLEIDGEKKEFNAGEEHGCFKCDEDDCGLEKRDRCRPYTGFSAFILDPNTGKIIIPRPYRFQTNSVNSSDNLLTELFSIFNGFGGVKNIPFELTVKMAETQTETGKKTKYPIWNLQAYGSVAMINMFRERTQLPTRDDNAIIMDESKMLATTKPEPDSEPEETDDSAELLGEDPLPEDMRTHDEVIDKFVEELEAEPVVNVDNVWEHPSNVRKKFAEDIDDANMMTAAISAMILHMTNSEKTKARAMLKKLSKHPTTKKSYDKTADIKILPIGELRGIYQNVKDEYKKFLTGIVAKESQLEIL